VGDVVDQLLLMIITTEKEPEAAAVSSQHTCSSIHKQLPVKIGV
jgi:hypothetical protein